MDQRISLSVNINKIIDMSLQMIYIDLIDNDIGYSRNNQISSLVLRELFYVMNNKLSSQ